MRINNAPTKFIPYSDTYKEICFLSWYKAGRPTGSKFLEAVPSDEMGRKPTLQLMHDWRTLNNWDARADILDAEVARQIEKKAIEEKVEMFNRHAAVGRELQEKGLDFLRDQGIEKDSTAIRMIISGAEMERASRGLPDALLKVAELQDSDLQSMVSKLLQHFDPNDTNVTLEQIENSLVDEVVEGEVKDASD